MTDADELTDAEIAELRAQLEHSQAEVEHSLAMAAENAKPVDLGLSIGRLSRVDALQQQHMAIARRDRVEVRLRQIRTALGRIRSGTYGSCVKCGEPIGVARLRTRPEAPFCRECQ